MSYHLGIDVGVATVAAAVATKDGADILALDDDAVIVSLPDAAQRQKPEAAAVAAVVRLAVDRAVAARGEPPDGIALALATRERGTTTIAEAVAARARVAAITMVDAPVAASCWLAWAGDRLERFLLIDLARARPSSVVDDRRWLWSPAPTSIGDVGVDDTTRHAAIALQTGGKPAVPVDVVAERMGGVVAAIARSGQQSWPLSSGPDGVRVIGGVLEVAAVHDAVLKEITGPSVPPVPGHVVARGAALLLARPGPPVRWRPLPLPASSPAPRGPADAWQQRSWKDRADRAPLGRAPARQEPPTEVGAAPEASAVHSGEARFTAYRPTRMRPAQWYPLLAFVHAPEPVRDPRTGVWTDPTREVAEQAERVLASEETAFSPVVGDALLPIAMGRDVVLAPWVDQGEVNPSHAVVRRHEPVQRADFRIRVHADPGCRLHGGMRAWVGPLLVAELDFVVTVSDIVVALPEVLTRSTVSPYRAVFVSYAHQDSMVVDRVVEYLRVVGDRFLMDVHDLRAGEVWSDRLKEMIVGADVFQLFWSHHAMHSEHVRREWEYALALNRHAFVRPVYWQVPRPADSARGLPPPALEALHWAKLPEILPAAERPVAPSERPSRPQDWLSEAEPYGPADASRPRLSPRRLRAVGRVAILATIAVVVVVAMVALLSR